MAKTEILIIIAFAAIVYCVETEDSELKKRGVGKTTPLNSIPTGAHKSEYSFSAYSPNLNSHSPSGQPYRSHGSSSFYPSQASSPYYSSSHPSTIAPSTYSSPQLASPQSSSHFVPINFVPSPGYQSKYQASPKSPNVKLGFVPQIPTQSALSYQHLAQSWFAPNQGYLQSPVVQQLPQYNIPSNYQPLQVGNAYLGQPSTMVLLAQPNSPVYSNLLYPNPVQNLYNYYPSNSQTKYSAYPSSSQSEYGSYQGPVAPSAPKEDNEVATQSADYPSFSDSTSSYKNDYSSRNAYGKLK